MSSLHDLFCPGSLSHFTVLVCTRIKDFFPLSRCLVLALITLLYAIQHKPDLPYRG